MPQMIAVNIYLGGHHVHRHCFRQQTYPGRSSAFGRASARGRPKGRDSRQRQRTHHLPPGPKLGQLLPGWPHGQRRLSDRACQPAPAGAGGTLLLRYLLDPHIVIYVLKRRPVEVLSTFNANASRMAISAITLAELLHGAEKSSRVSENLAAIEDFCSRLQVLPYGPKAAALRRHSVRLGKTRPAYRCERHAHCSSRSQRRLGAGDEQHGGVRTGACAGSRELGPYSAVIDGVSR
jgi:predicted nucleic acid-binding protein